MIGYHLSSEEHGPKDLTEFAMRAEDAGFGFAQISDHFHPWTNRQGQSPFVWGVVGALAQVTERIDIGTAVTCPTIRIHPAIIAQAAATAACQLEGRFFLGVGTGERLNEHVLGDRWPPPSVRLEMLEEAIEVIRELWTGKLVTRRGEHYTVENARIFTLPDALPPIVVSAFGDDSLALAARVGEGLMSTAADADVVGSYREQGGRGLTYSMTHVCVAETQDEARATARAWWPNSTIPGSAPLELSVPEHFEPLAEASPDEAFDEAFVLGNDPSEHIEELQRHLEAGYDRVAVHQVGPDQDAFFRLYAEEVLPRLDAGTAAA